MPDDRPPRSRLDRGRSGGNPAKGHWSQFACRACEAASRQPNNGPFPPPKTVPTSGRQIIRSIGELLEGALPSLCPIQLKRLRIGGDFG